MVVPTQIVLEPSVADYDPALYDGVPSPVAKFMTFESVSQTDIARYRAHGYLCSGDVLPKQLIADALDELRAMALAADPDCEAVFFEALLREHLRDPLAGDSSGTNASEQEASAIRALDPALRSQNVRKFAGFVERHPALARLAGFPPLVALVERLIGGPSSLLQDMALVKPPAGREKPWHQDHAYFNLPLAANIVGVWIPLHSVNQANGCMHVIPGSHRGGALNHFQRRDWQICDSDIIGQAQHALPMDPGELMLFDSKLAHGTPTNATQEMRWALQFHYAPADAPQIADSERLAAFGAEGKDVTC